MLVYVIKKVWPDGSLLQILADYDQDFLTERSFLENRLPGRCVELQPFSAGQRKISLDPKNSSAFRSGKQGFDRFFQGIFRKSDIHEKEGRKSLFGVKPEFFMIGLNPARLR